LSEHLKLSTSFSPVEIRKAVVLSNGNYIEARRYLEQQQDEELHFTEFRNWMLMSYQGKIKELNVLLEELARYPREKLKSFLGYGTLVIRYCYHLHLMPDPEIRLEGKELEFIRNFSKFVHHGNAESLFSLFNEAIYHIERNANASILLMDLSLQLNRLLRTPLVRISPE
ncbi:MAG: hypothetical protein NTU44_17985, partial [Bacteroidetes bacterium]|nr:hypothetical protein [Bacteroidota bacterium]